MVRVAVLLILGSVLVGCQGSTAPIDPFATYGPTRIPPPATGSARQNDPYYRGTASASGAVAPDVSPYARFTSADEQNAAVQVADRRAAAQAPAATASSVSSVGDGTSTTAGRRLDWRSPVAGSAGYAPPVSAPTQSPRPVFPTTPPTGSGTVGMPYEPMTQTGPPTDPATHTRY
jgi:hypothetical protein